MNVRRPTWHRFAECTDTDPDIFYPDHAGLREAHVARQYCARCPVQPRCLDWGLRYENNGIWGGLTARERKQINQARALVDRARA